MNDPCISLSEVMPFSLCIGTVVRPGNNPSVITRSQQQFQTIFSLQILPHAFSALRLPLVRPSK